MPQPNAPSSTVKDISDNQWDVFLETLIDADGTIQPNAVCSRVFYGKKATCDDVQIQASLHDKNC